MDSSTRFTMSAPLRHDTNKRLSFRSPDILAIYTNRNQPMVRPGSVVGDRLANTDCSCSCRSLPCRGGDTPTPSQVPDAWPPPIIRPPNLKEHKLLHQTVRVLLVPHGSTQGDGLIGIQNPGHWLLNEEGVAQAHALMETLKTTQISAVFSSDLKSALSTVEIILEGQSGLPPLEVDARLKIFDQARAEEMASSVGDVPTETPSIRSGQETDPLLEKQSIEFWETLFTSAHPLVCRPAIDLELTVPMGQFSMSPKAKLDKACRDGRRSRVCTSTNVGNGSLGGTRFSRASKHDLTIVIISDPASIRTLVQSLSIHEGQYHEPLRWETDAFQMAQEEKFCPPGGSITEIIMTGTQKQSTLAMPTQYRDRKTERQYWTWQGVVQKFGHVCHMNISPDCEMDHAATKARL